METVEVVIKIPKQDFDFIIDEFAEGDMPDKKDLKETTYYAIANGTVLPKGHGRLIDVDEVEAILHNKAFDMVESNAKFYTIRWAQKIVRNAPTVIEADKAESER